MNRKKAPDLQIHSGTAESIAYQLSTGLEFLETLGPGVGLQSLPDRLSGLVEERVARMVALLDGVDTLDLLGHMKQADITNIMSSPGESWSSADESHGVTEVVVLILLGLGLPRVAREDARYAAEVVEDLRANAAWIVQASQMAAVVESETAGDAITRVALRSRAHGIAARNFHYTRIGRQLNKSFFDRPKVRALMEAHLGFTGEDVEAVVRVLEEIQQQRIVEAFEKIRALMGVQNPPPEQAKAALEEIFVTPGGLFAVTPESVAVAAGIEPERARAVLDTFVAAPRQAPPSELVRAFTRGENPLASSGLLKVEDGVYFPLATALLSEHVRRRIEDAFKNSPSWARFDEQRKKWSEGRAKALLGAALGGAQPLLENFNYLVPDSDGDIGLLAAGTRPATVGVKQVEGDLLFLVDNVAFCVEVKAGSLNERARSGETRSALRGLNGIVAKADEQAERLRALILENQGIWTARRKWVDLSEVEEVHNLVVVLEDLGPVILSTAGLIEAGLIKSERVPWIVSVHDLTVVRDVFEHPAQVLTYVRRRTQAEAARWLEAVDELDVMMFFLNGNLYFESDPAQGRDGRGPRSGDVAKARRYRQQGPVLVGTLTDPLDAWYERGESLKPARDEGEFVTRFLVWSRERQVPGWLRVGADLVGLASHERGRFVRELARVVGAARQGSSGNMTIGSDDDGSGRWLFVLGGDSPGHRIDVKSYLPLKKYQYRARRATTWVFDANGDPSRYAHISGTWTEDPAMETAVHDAEQEGRLVAIARTPAAIPPSARRKTKRMRGRRRRGR